MQIEASFAQPQADNILVENEPSSVTKNYVPPKSDCQGIFIAVTIIILFALFWFHALFQINLIDIERRSPWWDIIGTFLILEFLYTGLFITCHDAMHGTISYRVSIKRMKKHFSSSNSYY